MTTTAPVFTLQERDRRWARIRAFLTERNLAGLVIAGLRGREGFEPYVSNESIQGVVVFPADGDPVHLTWNAFRILGRDDPGNDREYWIDDIRAGLIGPGIVAALTGAGLSAERVGVIGLRNKSPMELEGYVPHAMWSHVVEQLRTLPPWDDAVLAEGMLFSFEPNACHGRHRVNIGGTVAVGPSGPEELNTLPCRLHEVG